MTSGNRGRIEELDLFRYFTVTLAIVSHIVIHHQIYDEAEGGLAMLFKVITRMATPSLVILMGVMVEVVYARRFAGRQLDVISALLHRAFVCAALYLVLSLANDGFAALNGALAPFPLVWVETGYGAIFLTYAALLLIAPVWLWLRVRFGFLPVLLLSLAFVLFHAIALDGVPRLGGTMGLATSVLFGLGDDRGPSVFHALGLMTFGMALGNALFCAERRALAVAIAIAGAAASFLILAGFVILRGIEMTAHLITDITHWRHQNAVGYYAFGILAAYLVMGMTFIGHRLLPAMLVAPLRAVGRDTLAYFFIGTILLQAVPVIVLARPMEAIAAIIVYLGVFGALALGWDVIRRSTPSSVSVKPLIKSLVARTLRLSGEN